MKLDKSIFTQQSFSDAADHQKLYRTKSDKEKSDCFFYLMQVAFGFVGKPWPRMDKGHFESRKRS